MSRLSGADGRFVSPDRPTHTSRPHPFGGAGPHRFRTAAPPCRPAGTPPGTPEGPSPGDRAGPGALLRCPAERPAPGVTRPVLLTWNGSL